MSQVESITDVRVGKRGRPEFLVKWKGYPASESTWLPLSNFTAGFSFRKAMTPEAQAAVPPGRLRYELGLPAPEEHGLEEKTLLPGASSREQIQGLLKSAESKRVFDAWTHYPRLQGLERSRNVLQLQCLLPENSVDLVIADPPYYVGIAAWDRPEARNIEFMHAWLRVCTSKLKPGKDLLIWGSSMNDVIYALHDRVVQLWGRQSFVQTIDWVYSVGHIGGKSKYFNRFDILLWFKKPMHPTEDKEASEEEAEREEHAARRPYFACQDRRPLLDYFTFTGEEDKAAEDIFYKHVKGRGAQCNWNVLYYPRAHKFRACNIPGVRHHESMKPLALCERLILNHSSVGDTVLIPFAGSGSEVIAALFRGRNAIATELEAAYLPLIFCRLANMINFFLEHELLEDEEQDTARAQSPPELDESRCRRAEETLTGAGGLLSETSLRATAKRRRTSG